MKNKLSLFLLTFTGILLTACVASTPIANIYLNSANYLNPDINGRSSPVVVSLYQLKSPYSFKTANFDMLTNHASQILGTDLIDRKSVEIRPDTQKKIIFNFDQNTQYLGITVAYRNINSAKWREVIHLPNKSKNFSLQINLESEGLSVKVIKKAKLI